MPFDDGTGNHFDHGAEDDHEEFDRLRPPPHPDDRLWRHPSEVGAGSRPPGPVTPPPDRRRSRPAGSSPRRRGRPRWALLALAAGGGGMVAAAGLAAVGVRERIVERTVTERVAVTSGVTNTSPLAVGPSPGSGEPVGGTVDEAVVHLEGDGGRGSGFLLRDDGTVVTSAAIVGYATAGTVPVTLGDGRRVSGRIRGSDEVTDVAVVSLPDGEYPTVVLAVDTPAVRGSELAVVARHPDGGTGRSQGVMASASWAVQREDLPPLDGLLQVSTASTPVAHGGPVVDHRDAVVGMTTRSYRSWSYAVPIDVATKVADDLLTTGAAQHPWLGIEGTGVDGADGMAAGVAVTDVATDGPASGLLQPGDVIVGWNGTPVPDMTTLQAQLLRHRPGDVAEITVNRDGDTAPTRVTIDLGPAE